MAVPLKSFSSDAAIASNWWTAEQAVRAAAPRYSGPATSLADVMATLDAALDAGDFVRLSDRGDFTDTVGGAHAFAATYRVAPALHDGLEPLTATARFSGGRLEVWAPVQAYDAAVAIAAKAAGVGIDAVTLYPMPVGDPSGRSDLRKVMTDEIIEHNCECFKKQISRFIDFSDGKALMVNNGDWLRKLNYIDLGPARIFYII